MTAPSAGDGWAAQTSGNGLVIVLSGDWIAADRLTSGLPSIPAPSKGLGGIAFETSGLGRWDSALLIFLAGIRSLARENAVTFDADGLPKAAVGLLALIAEDLAEPPPKAAPASLAARTGAAVIATGNEALAIAATIGETVLRGLGMGTGRLRMRRADFMTCAYDAGIAALPIVTVVNVLVGGILAFVGAVQLRKFGADIFIAALVGIAMVREMAALMTAIVMSGRTGGAYAAQIAAMLGNEEIDALRAIGIPLHDYLILPRILALTATMPLLYLFGCATGIFGGFAVSVAMLNLSPEAFLTQTRASIALSQLFFGLVKSTAFGLLIAIAGCRCGLKAGRGAADVGTAATDAVVIGIVGVIALDAIFAMCAHALDF